jgi:hypothetical protein
LAQAPDILGGMTIAFTPEPDVAERLEKLCQAASLEVNEAINILLDSPLEQIIEQRDSCLLQCCIHPFVYDTKEEALSVIAGYKRFVSEDDSRCYRSGAKPARTSDGHWEILFKSTHPWDEGEARTDRTAVTV